MLNIYDIVSINRDDEAHGLVKGQQGTIVDVLLNGEAFVVEFFDKEGNTIEDALFADYKLADLLLIKAFNSEK